MHKKSYTEDTRVRIPKSICCYMLYSKLNFTENEILVLEIRMLNQT